MSLSAHESWGINSIKSFTLRLVMTYQYKAKCRGQLPQQSTVFFTTAESRSDARMQAYCTCSLCWGLVADPLLNIC